MPPPFGHRQREGRRVVQCGGENEVENIALVRLLCAIAAAVQGRPVSEYEKLVAFVKDRPGHDRRYASLRQDQAGARLAASGCLRGDGCVPRQWYLDNGGWSSGSRPGNI